MPLQPHRDRSINPMKYAGAGLPRVPAAEQLRYRQHCGRCCFTPRRLMLLQLPCVVAVPNLFVISPGASCS